jgi:hypothetical protein
LEDNLFVLPQYIGGQVCAAVGRESGAVVENSVADFLLAVGAGDTIIDAVMVFGVNFAGGNYRDVFNPRPRHYSADMCQNPSVISYKALAIGQKEVFLRINVYQDAFPLFFEQLLKHFSSLAGT